jgi:rhodanese-related sulfurtransferase
MMLALAVFAGAAVLVLAVRKRRLFSRAEARAGIRVLSAPEMAKRLAEGWRPVVLDVRTVREYRGPLGRIAGSLLIPVAELAGRIRELEERRNDPVIAVCLGGVRSARAAGLLLQAGFLEVYNLAGGMQAWQAEKLPVDR